MKKVQKSSLKSKEFFIKKKCKCVKTWISRKIRLWNKFNIVKDQNIIPNYRSKFTNVRSSWLNSYITAMLWRKLSLLKLFCVPYFFILGLMKQDHKVEIFTSLTAFNDVPSILKKSWEFVLVDLLFWNLGEFLISQITSYILLISWNSRKIR